MKICVNVWGQASTDMRIICCKMTLFGSVLRIAKEFPYMTISYMIMLPLSWNIRWAPWTQGVNWTYIRRSEGVLDVFWASYVRSICVCVHREVCFSPTLNCNIFHIFDWINQNFFREIKNHLNFRFLAGWKPPWGSGFGECLGQEVVWWPRCAEDTTFRKSY